MATLEERVAYLEGKVEEHSHTFPGVLDAIGRLDSRFEARFASLEHRMDARFEAAERRFEGLERRVDRLDDKVSRQFIWVVGIQITTFIALLGAMLSRG